MSPSTTSDQKCHLMDLPNELFDNIISFIKEPCALAKLSICNHQLHEAVEPALWSSFTRSEDTSRDAHDLRPFLLSILQRPELGNLVRRLKITHVQSFYGREIYTYPVRCVTQDQDDLLVAAIHEINPVDCEEWESAIDNEVSELDFALLLTKLPKLEMLSFQTSTHTMPLMMELAEIAMNRGGHPYLKELKRLDVEYAELEQYEESYEFMEYKWLLELPTLKEFRGVQCCEEDDFDRRPDLRNPAKVFAPRSLNIEDLTFERSGMCEDALLAILTACKRVRSFKFEFQVGDICGIEGQFKFDFLIRNIQSFHGASLECLWFFADGIPYEDCLNINALLWHMATVVREKFPVLREIVLRFPKIHTKRVASLPPFYTAQNIQLRIDSTIGPCGCVGRCSGDDD